MPAYNEAGRIQHAINEVIAFFSQTSISFEVIVIDDGSSDDTFIIANKIPFPNLYVERMPSNQGKGKALQNAFLHAKGDLVLFLDADLDIHPSQFVALFHSLQNADAEVAIGTKRGARAQGNYPFFRRILSSGYALVVRALFRLPFEDTQTGIKLFKTDVLRNVLHKVSVNGYAFDLELMTRIHQSGYKVVETAVRLQYGTKDGHMTLRVIFKMLVDTIVILFRIGLRDRP